MPIAVLPASQDQYLSRWIERDKSLSAYDPRIEAVLCPLIPVGGRVVDVGANIGDHTVAYAERVGPDGIVWAIEPYEIVLPCLRINTAAYPQVRILPVALGADDHTGCLMDNPWNTGVTCIAPMTIPHDSPLAVPVLPLDALHLERVDYLKIDVEGYEFEVLQGATETLARWSPVVVLELHVMGVKRYGHTPAEILAWLRDRGYDLEQVPPAPWQVQYLDNVRDFIGRRRRA